MKIIFLLLLCGPFQLALAKGSIFYGAMSIKVDTNVPGFSFRAKTVKKVLINVKKINKKIQDAFFSLDPKFIDTGIKLRNQHMLEKVFYKKPITFKSSKVNCVEKKLCNLKGNLTVGQFTKEIDVKIEWSSKKEFSFQKKLSLNEMKVPKIEFLKLYVKDIVIISGEFKES